MQKGDGSQLVAQFMEGGVCIAWNLLVGGAIFWALGKVIGSNRVSAAVEIAGLDIPEMGALAYPEFVTAVAPESVSAADIAIAKVG